MTTLKRFIAARYTPGLIRVAREPQALERDRDEDDVAFFGDFAFGVPEGIEAGIVHAFGGVDVVHLDAVRIDGEAVIAAVVVEGVDRDVDPVVAHDGAVSTGDVGADLGRVVVAGERDIDVFVVVGQIRGGRQADRFTVAGIELAELGDFQFGFPGGAGQKVLQPGLARHFGDSARGCLLGERRRYGDQVRYKSKQQPASDSHAILHG